MDIPSRVAVMTLPNAVLFPQALLPLYIFEPRYRAMLADAIESHRMFAVALAQWGKNKKEAPHPIAAVGVIRVAVDNPDGTSNLILQGLSRVRILEIVQKEPYLIAEVQPLESTNATGVEVEALTSRVTELAVDRAAQIGKAPSQVSAFLSDLKDPDILSDILSFTLIPDCSAKQRLLETSDVRQRLHDLISLLINLPANAGVVDASQ